MLKVVISRFFALVLRLVRFVPFMAFVHLLYVGDYPAALFAGIFIILCVVLRFFILMFDRWTAKRLRNASDADAQSLGEYQAKLNEYRGLIPFTTLVIAIITIIEEPFTAVDGTSGFWALWLIGDCIILAMIIGSVIRKPILRGAVNSNY